MLALKILGAIDLLSALVFLMLIFGISPFVPLILFCSALLVLKGLFVLTGNILSLFDILFAIVLLSSIFFSLPAVLLWVPAFFLLAKGMVSFI